MSTQNHHESLADPATLNEFISSLQRLFKIGIYYPQGHAILDKATNRFMLLLATLAGDNPSVMIQDHGDTLMVEGVDIDRNHPFVQEFKGMLSTLGITAITIDREITMEELHVFVRKMISFKAEIIAAKQFIRIDIDQLPHSIDIKLKEFLAREDGSISDDSSGQATENISSFIDSLASYGLKDDEITQCRELLDALPARLMKSDIDLSILPHASWDDIARLLAKAVSFDKKAEEDIRTRVSTHTHINALASILRQLEKETEDKKSQESINLLVSIIRRPLADAEMEIAEDEDVGGRIFPDKPSMSIDQIQEFTTKNRLHPKILKNIPETSGQDETLSILMQLAEFDQTLQTQIRMQQVFREILSSKLSKTKWEILSSGLHRITRQGKKARISSTVKLLVEPLRRSRHENPLNLFFLTTQLCDADENKRLWPYVVNEILVNGSNKDQQSYQYLCQIAANLSTEEMLATLPQLQMMESFQDNAIAPDIFVAVPRRCYPLFAFLYKTEIAAFIGERVLGGLRRNPPDWLSKAIVP
ncbi:MAG: hypothetical protein V2I35_06620, partial [Desulfocapsaceae bacterium]|nr:hypothetical protein [Desulfocapsaceae bacterium]